MIAGFRGGVVARMIKAIAKDLDTDKNGVVSPKEVNRVLTDIFHPTVVAVCERLNEKPRK